MPGSHFGIPDSWIIGIIFLLMGLALTMRFGNPWASIPFRIENRRKRASLLPVWQRPSTILLVIVVGFTIYTRSISGLTEFAVAVFFVLRYWEYHAFSIDDVNESDVDKAHDEVLGGSSKPKDRRWYDDD